MLTASVVTYHTSLPEAGAVLDCVLRSSIDKLYIIDNSRNDALRILENGLRKSGISTTPISVTAELTISLSGKRWNSVRNTTSF